MTTKVSSIGLKGIEGYRVQVEVHVTLGTKSMVIVGLPDASVKESKERVLSTLRTLKWDMSGFKVVVNLSPVEQKKNGPFFDLPMAIAILKERGHIKVEIPEQTAFIGALSLDGALQNVTGMLPALVAAKSIGFKRIYLPYDSTIPFHMFEDSLELMVVHHINDVVEHLKGQRISLPPPYKENQQPTTLSHDLYKDFCHIIGHEQAKRALEIAAAGEHNVLMSGPPGCGKSLLSEAFPSILPSLTREQQLEVMSLYQLAGEQLCTPHIPPYRHPHHSASSVSIIGGGSNPKPGEISLAHGGVLFLDEMAEFTKKTLDMLRQPLESGKVTISRVHSTVTYPASFILVGAMNPCPCGYLGSNIGYCTCTAKQIQAYRNRVSGPVLDRIDLLLSLNPVHLDNLESERESSSAIRERVEKARKRQYVRYEKEVSNGKVPFEQLIEKSPLTKQQRNMLTKISNNQHWSNRGEIKIIRLARTISDLAGKEHITDESIWEAMTLRRVKHVKQSLAAREP